MTVAVDATTVVAVAMTADAVTEPAFLAAVPVTVSSGASSFCAAAAITAATVDADVATTITAGSS